MKHPKDRIIIQTQCAVCGKHGSVIVEKGTGKFIEKGGWDFWGKMLLNSEKTEPYFYRWESGKINHKKIPNSEYDPKVAKLYTDYFECPTCLKKVAKREKEAEHALSTDEGVLVYLLSHGAIDRDSRVHLKPSPVVRLLTQQENIVEVGTGFYLSEVGKMVAEGAILMAKEAKVKKKEVEKK